MDPFVRRLVERLNDPARPLSRNRHFHTFDNPDGQQALRIARRLHALRQDIEKCLREGGRPIARPTDSVTAQRQVEISLASLKSRRRTLLEADEFELLRQLPGMEAALR
jgi:hypothetical protein